MRMRTPKGDKDWVLVVESTKMCVIVPTDKYINRYLVKHLYMHTDPRASANLFYKVDKLIKIYFFNDLHTHKAWRIQFIELSHAYSGVICSRNTRFNNVTITPPRRFGKEAFPHC